MNSYIYWLCFLPLIIALFMTYRHEKQVQTILRIKRKKRKAKGKIIMSEIIKRYIGKKCNVTTMSGSVIVGVITEASDGWINIDNGKNNQAINLDYITQISEIPVKKLKKS